MVLSVVLQPKNHWYLDETVVLGSCGLKSMLVGTAKNGQELLVVNIGPNEKHLRQPRTTQEGVIRI